MTCPSCNDFGVFRVAYHDGSPAEYALCLCAKGEQMRLAKNNGKPVAPHWQVWASQEGIPFDRVAPMEEILSNDELTARGFGVPSIDVLSREASLLDVGKKAKR